MALMALTRNEAMADQAVLDRAGIRPSLLAQNIYATLIEASFRLS